MAYNSDQNSQAVEARTIASQGVTPLILIVTRNGRVSESAMKYSLSIAERLGYNMLVAYVNTMPFLWDGGRRERFLEKAAKENFREFRALIQDRNTHLASVKEYGKVGKVIHRLCHIVKRVDMVVVDKGVNMDEVVSCSPVPVFNSRGGGRSLSRGVPSVHKQSRLPFCLRGPAQSRRSLINVSLLGFLVGMLYFFFFSHVDAIMNSCTQGGLYAVFPVLAASVFFLVQNAFIGAVVAGLKQQKACGMTNSLAALSPNPYKRQTHRAQR